MTNNNYPKTTGASVNSVAYQGAYSTVADATPRRIAATDYAHDLRGKNLAIEERLTAIIDRLDPSPKQENCGMTPEPGGVLNLLIDADCAADRALTLLTRLEELIG